MSPGCSAKNSLACHVCQGKMMGERLGKMEFIWIFYHMLSLSSSDCLERVFKCCSCFCKLARYLNGNKCLEDLRWIHFKGLEECDGTLRCRLELVGAFTLDHHKRRQIKSLGDAYFDSALKVRNSFISRVCAFHAYRFKTKSCKVDKAK